MFDLEKNKYYSLHLFNEHLSFPVLMGAKNEQESKMICSYLTAESTKEFTLVDYIEWSKSHLIDYQVLFPNMFKLLIKDPKRFLCYLSIRKYFK